MKNFIFATALQSTGALVALDTVPTDIVPNVIPNIGFGDVKHEVIAIGASIVVSALRWAFIKWIKPIFVKTDETVKL